MQFSAGYEGFTIEGSDCGDEGTKRCKYGKRTLTCVINRLYCGGGASITHSRSPFLRVIKAEPWCGTVLGVRPGPDGCSDIVM